MLPSSFILLCVVFRLLPHPANFAPVGAVAVFAGRTLPPRRALLLVLAAMFAGDLALAWIHGRAAFDAVTPFVYAGFLGQAWLGKALRARPGGAVAAALAGSLLFFTVSNLGVWAASGLYSRDGAGLGACFIAAWPFLGATAASDLIWTLLLCLLYRPLALRWSDRPLWVPWPVSGKAAI